MGGDFHVFKRKKIGTWVNAMMFYQAWKDIREKSLFDNSDYFVKVDADAVFLPQRLQDTLAGYKAPAGGIYIENCAKAEYGFFGNLEVVSAEGFNTFLSSLEDCKAELPKALRKVKNLKYKPDCATVKTCGIHPMKKPFDYFTCLAATQA